MSTFHEDLRFATEIAKEPWVTAIYENVITSYLGQELITDLALQKKGVDRIVYISDPNRPKLFVEEKILSEPRTEIPLEYVSDRFGAPPTDGYVEKRGQLTDLIVFIFVPTQEYIIWAWREFQAAWLAHKDEWKGKFGGDHDPRNVAGENRSLCCFVPIDVICKAVKPLREKRLSPEQLQAYASKRGKTIRRWLHEAWTRWKESK
jgi:hypothetical protein